MISLICRTRRLLQQLEAHQSSLVSQDVVLKQRSTIDQLESDLRMLSDNHKRLIERYTVLKSTIEDSSTTLSSELAAKVGIKILLYANYGLLKDDVSN